jgi:hypothetical protein
VRGAWFAYSEGLRSVRMPPDRGGFTWDARSGRYKDARRRYVTHAQVRAWLDAALDNASERMAALSRQLQARQIDLVTWQVRMAREVKNVQLYSAAAAKGGWAQLSLADLGRVGQSVRVQLEFLNDFAREIRSGKQALGGMEWRARLYAQAGRMMQDATQRAEMRIRGYDEEANDKAPGDSCPGCVGETGRGWVPLGALVPIGRRTCRVNCRCRTLYRKSATGEMAR